MEIDMAANFDIKIGFILKEMIKMAKQSNPSGGDINLIDIVDLLKAHLEESTQISTLKSEIVFYVFEFLLLSDAKDLYNCDLMPKIVEVVFAKYLKKKEFSSAIDFCKFMTRKFDAIYKGRVNKKAKFILSDGMKEHFKIFIFYFIFQNEYILERICGPQVASACLGAEIVNELENAPPAPPQQPPAQQAAPPAQPAQPAVDEESAKAFLTISRNFMKVINSLAFYDKKLDSVKEVLMGIRSNRLIVSLQIFLCGVASRFKAEEVNSNEEKALKAITEVIGFSIVVHLYQESVHRVGVRDRDPQVHRVLHRQQLLIPVDRRARTHSVSPLQAVHDRSQPRTVPLCLKSEQSQR